jgi:peptidoglycan hydrolase-like protein with peptidoglycan-binding domain
MAETKAAPGRSQAPTPLQAILSKSDFTPPPMRSEHSPPELVKKVRSDLNKCIFGLRLPEDGKWGPATANALKLFQAKMGAQAPSGAMDEKTVGRLDAYAFNATGTTPGSQSLPRVSDKPYVLTDKDYEDTAKQLNISVEKLRALAAGEGRKAFLKTGQPVARFESHVFSRLTFGAFDLNYSDISVAKQNNKLSKGGSAA